MSCASKKKRRSQNFNHSPVAQQRRPGPIQRRLLWANRRAGLQKHPWRFYLASHRPSAKRAQSSQPQRPKIPEQTRHPGASIHRKPRRQTRIPPPTFIHYRAFAVPANPLRTRPPHPAHLNVPRGRPRRPQTMSASYSPIICTKRVEQITPNLRPRTRLGYTGHGRQPAAPSTWNPARFL